VIFVVACIQVSSCEYWLMARRTSR